MDNASPASSSSLHPLLWIAGVSVTLLSLVGIAALTGLLPFHSSVPAASEPASGPSVAAASAPVPPPVAIAPAIAPPPVAVAPTEPPEHHAVKRKPVAKSAPVPGASAAIPPVGSGVPPDYVPPPANVGVPPDYAPPPVAVAPPLCAECGVVASVRQIKHEGKGSGLGAVAGGVLGGAIANNLGHGNGRTLATIAGAVGGGLLGNKIEKSQNETTSYQITVHMDDGTDRLLDAIAEPSWRIGDHVKVVNGRVTAR